VRSWILGVGVKSSDMKLIYVFLNFANWTLSTDRVHFASWKLSLTNRIHLTPLRSVAVHTNGGRKWLYYAVRSESRCALRLRYGTVRYGTVRYGTYIWLSVSKLPLQCAAVSLYSVVKQRLKCNTGKVCNCLIQFLLTMVRSIEECVFRVENLWPPRSPDLTPPDFYLWWAAKSAVYRHRHVRLMI
jgi:hypothetical protein